MPMSNANKETTTKRSSQKYQFDEEELAKLENISTDHIEDDEVIKEFIANILRAGSTVPIEDIVRREFTYKPALYDEVIYTTPNEITPWISISDEVSEQEVKEIGYELHPSGVDSVVYCLKCSLRNDNRLKDVKKLARDTLPNHDTSPGWLYYAWKAEDVYYIGSTGILPERLTGHVFGERTGNGGTKEPSKLTAISDIESIAIARRFDSRKRAYQYENAIGTKLTHNNESAFIYQA